jgi:DNA adenine methylase
MTHYLPTKYNRYREHFVGGGALFFHLQPKYALLSDSNERLIRTYRTVRDSVDDLVRLLSTYPNEKTFFLELRKKNIDAMSDVEVASWFIYLNKTCFNGVYRVNKDNQFNVPFGSQANPTICDEENLRLCSEALRGVELLVGDYIDLALLHCRAGDFVYLDPPYVPLSATSSFTAYGKEGFDMRCQQRLVVLSRHLKSSGVSVLLSNSAAPAVRELYEGFELIPVMAARSVNSKVKGRGKIAEYLIR